MKSVEKYEIAHGELKEPEIESFGKLRLFTLIDKDKKVLRTRYYIEYLNRNGENIKFSLPFYRFINENAIFPEVYQITDQDRGTGKKGRRQERVYVSPVNDTILKGPVTPKLECHEGPLSYTSVDFFNRHCILEAAYRHALVEKGLPVVNPLALVSLKSRGGLLYILEERGLPLQKIGRSIAQALYDSFQQKLKDKGLVYKAKSRDGEATYCDTFNHKNCIDECISGCKYDDLYAFGRIPNLRVLASGFPVIENLEK